MNKKISLAVLTALSISLPLFGCGNKAVESDNKQQIEQNVSVQGETENVDYSKSYDSVLSKYREFAKDFNSTKFYEEKYKDEPWSNMSTMPLTESEEYGYAFKDLNGNGVDELLLLTKENDDYRITAIYSLVGDKPTLLKSFFERYRGYIGKDGLIYTSGSNSAWDHSYEKLKISSDGTAIQIVEELESNSFDEKTNERMQDKDGKVLVKYYRTQEDGKRNEISKQEYDELSDKIPSDNKQSGLDFIKLAE